MSPPYEPLKKIRLCPDMKIFGRPGEANHSIPGFRGGRDGGRRGGALGVVEPPGTGS